MANPSYWDIDSDGSWTSAANWYSYNGVVYTHTVPGANSDVSLTPYDPTGLTSPGSDPFTITYNTTVTINNLAASSFVTLNMTGGALIVSNGMTFGGDLTVTAGTLTVQNGGSSSSVISGTLTNTGTVAVQAGALTLDGGGSSSASALNISSGATIDFDSGTFVLGAGSTVGTGTVAVTNTAVLSLGSGNVTITGGFSESGGTVSGTGTLTLAGGASFASNYAVMTGSGTTVLQGTTSLSGSTIALDGGRVLENKGTFNWTIGSIYLGYNPYGTSLGEATLQNDANATFNIQTTGTISANSGMTAITNAGTLQQTVTTGTTTINPDFTNTGTVSVQTGTMDFEGLFTNTGTVSVSNGATLVINGGGSSALSALSLASGSNLVFGGSGTFVLGAGASTGTGAVSVTANAVLSLGATNATITGGFSQGGGTVSGTGTLTLAGGATFNTNYALMTGSGTTVLQGTTSLSGGTIALDGGRVLENKGTFNWTGGSIYLGYNPYGTTVGGATLQNDSGATFNIKVGATLSTNSGMTAITNAGTLQQTVTTGTTTINPDFTNTGTVSVQTGTMDFEGLFTNTGTVSVSNGATLVINGGGSSALSALSLASGSNLVFGGSGTFVLGAGASTGTGAVSVTANAVLSLGATNATITGGFSQGGGTVSGTGTLTLAGGATFNTNYALMTGSGTTVLQGTTSLSGGTIALDGGRVLENKGTFNWTGGSIYLGYNPYGTTVGGATLQNDSGATFNIKVGATLSTNSGMTAITNAGTLQQTVTTGTTTINPDFTNTGTVSVQTGTMDFEGLFTNTGTVSVSNGATLVINGGGSSALSALSLASGSNLVFGGSGTFVLGAGASTGTGAVSVTANAVLSLGATNATITGGFSQGGGTVSGTGTLTLAGGATFNTNYALMTGTGTTVLQGTTSLSGGTIALDGGRVLENKGTFNWTGGSIYLGYNPYGTTVGGATLQNDSGATFNIKVGATLSTNSGMTAITNAGTLQQTVTTGTTTINPDFTNTGTVSVQTGTMDFEGLFTNTGTVSVSSGAALILNGGGSSNLVGLSLASGSILTFGGSGTFAVGAGASTGTGTVVVTGSAVLSLGATNATVTGSFRQTGGTLSGTGTLTLSSGATFNSNYAVMTGSGTTVLQGTTSLSGGTMALDGGRILENKGTFNWTSGSIYLGYNPYGTTVGGATLQNDAGATFNIQVGATLSANSGTTAITNAGTFQQTVTIGTTTINPAFTNTGTVSVQSGTLAFGGGGSSLASGLSISAGATFDVDGGTFALGAGSTVGTGTVSVTGSSAVLSLASANATITGAFRQTGGTVSGTATLTLAGGAIFASGFAVMTGTGTTVLQGTTSLSGGYIALDGGRVLENNGTFNWTSGSINLGYNPYGNAVGGATLKNDAGATFSIKTAATFSAYSGTVSIINAGMFQQTVTTGTTTINPAFINTGTVSVQTGNLIFQGAVANSGTIGVTGAASILEFGSPLMGSGTITIGLGTTAQFDTVSGAGTVSVGAGQIIAFAAGQTTQGETLKLLGSGITATTFGATIQGFQAQDTIDLPSQSGLTVQGFDGTTLTLAASGGATETFKFAGIRSGHNFTLAADGTGGTAIHLGAPVVTISSAGILTKQTSLNISGLSDAVEAGTTVKLYDNGSSTALATTTVLAGGAFSTTIALTGEGTHSIVVKDTDALGQVGTSPAVVFTLDTTAPVVKITSAPALTKQTTLTIVGTATDLHDVGTTVSIYDNGGSTAVGTGQVASGGTFNVSVTLAGEGTHSLVAKDTDLAGNAGQSSAVPVVVDTTPPAVTITNANLLTSQSAATITGSATDLHNAGSVVSLFDNGASTAFGTGALQSNSTYSIGVTLAGGDNLIVAKDTDGAGNTGSSSAIDAAYVAANAAYTNTRILGVATGFTLGGTAVLQNQGTLNQAGTAQIGDASSSQAQLVNAGGTYNLVGDVGITAGANAASLFDNKGGVLSKTSGSGVSAIAASFGNSTAAAAQIKVASGTLNFTGASNSFVNQAISGAGTFAIGGGGTSTIGGGTTIATSAWTIGKVGTTVTLGQNLTYAGSFSDTNQTVLNLGANTLTLSGAATFNLGVVGSPIIAGTGKLITSGTDTLGAFTLGGSVLFRSNGTVNQIGTITLGDSSNGAAQFTNAPGKSWSIQGDYSIVAGNSAAVFNNGGATLTKASGTGTSAIGTNFVNLAGTAATISIASGILNFTGATNSFVADAISGAGTFAIGGGGVSTIGAGTSITTASWTIAKVGTTVNLGETLAYAGNFSQTNQTTLNLGANTLTLSGPALFNLGPGGSPIINGTGKLITNGADSLGAFTLGGSVLLRNNGGVTQTGNITLGDSTNGSAQVTNAAGKSWVLTGDVGIVKGSTAALFNTGGGGFSKMGGTGVSTIGVNVINANATTSQIEVASGTLDFAGTVAGAQNFVIDAGKTLQFDASVAAGSGVSFAGTSGLLTLNDAPDFKGSIAGFGAGRSLDLHSVVFNAGLTGLAYSGTTAAGTLTVSDGTHVAKLAMLGNYAANAFHLASDSHGGSLVTYG